MTLGELLESFLSFFFEWVENWVAAVLQLGNVISFQIHWLEAHWLVATISCILYTYLFRLIIRMFSDIWKQIGADDDTPAEFILSILGAPLELLERMFIPTYYSIFSLIVIAMFIDFT